MPAYIETKSSEVGAVNGKIVRLIIAGIKVSSFPEIICGLFGGTEPVSLQLVYDPRTDFSECIKRVQQVMHCLDAMTVRLSRLRTVEF